MESAADRKRRADLEAQTAALARELRARIPAEVGFCLLMFHYDKGATAYAASAKRADMVGQLRRLISILEGS